MEPLALGQGAYPVSPHVHLSLVLCALGLGVRPRAVELPRKGCGCRPGSRGSPALQLRLDMGELGDRLGEVEPAGVQHLVRSLVPLPTTRLCSGLTLGSFCTALVPRSRIFY